MFPPKKKKLVICQIIVLHTFSFASVLALPELHRGEVRTLRSSRQPPQAMATRSKNCRAVTTSWATPISTRLDERRPLNAEVPRRAGTKPFGMSSWEEPRLAEVETGRPLFVEVDRKGSAMPKPKSPGPGHPPSNRAIGEISAGNQTACDTPSKSCWFALVRQPLHPS